MSKPKLESEVSPRECPKCDATSGNDWTQCRGTCPMEMSPYYKAKETEVSPREFDEAATTFAVNADNESGHFLTHQLEAIRARAFLAGIAHLREVQPDAQENQKLEYTRAQYMQILDANRAMARELGWAVDEWAIKTDTQETAEVDALAEWQTYAEANPPKGQSEFYYKDNREYWLAGFNRGLEAARKGNKK